MKKILFSLALTGITLAVSAQKITILNPDKVAANMPQYVEAQNKICLIAAQWQNEIMAKYIDLQKLKTKYAADELKLDKSTKQKREAMIKQKEKETIALQEHYFGKNGDLNKKRQELLKPFQG